MPINYLGYYVRLRVRDVDSQKDVDLDLPDLEFVHADGDYLATSSSTPGVHILYRPGNHSLILPAQLQDGCTALEPLHPRVSFCVPDRDTTADKPGCCVDLYYGHSTKGGVSIQVCKVIQKRDLNMNITRTEEPVPGIMISGTSSDLLATADTVTLQQSTDACGIARFLGLQSGTYTFRVQPLAGFVFTDPPEGVIVHSVCGGQLCDLAFRLQPFEATTWLLFLDENQRPLRDAVITLCGTGPDGRTLRKSFNSDSNGFAKIKGFSGMASISAQAKDKSTLQVSPQTVLTNGGINQISAYKPQQSKIQGQLTDSSGNPLENISVELLDAGGKQLQKVATGKGGRFLFTTSANPQGLTLRALSKQVPVASSSSTTED